MAAGTIFSDFGAQENKICHCSHCFPIYLPWSDGTRGHDLCFLVINYVFHSVQFSCWTMSDTLRPHRLQHARLPSPSPSPGACSNSCQSWWCHPTISSSDIPFSYCLRSFPVSESFPMSQFFTSGGQNIGVSTSASDLPMNIQDWFPSGLTGWISLQSKGLSRVFSNIIAQKRQFFNTQLSLWPNSHIHNMTTGKEHSFD